MRILVLGPVRALAGDTAIDLGPAGQRAVLGVLALACGRPLTRAEMIDTLWGERPPASAANVLQTHIKRLRRALEPDRRSHAPSTVLPHVGDGYALNVPDDALDLVQFRRLVAEALAARADGDPHRAVGLFGGALGLWRGAPLVDVPVLAQHPKVLLLVEERRIALTHQADAMFDAGAVLDAIPVLEEVVAAQPLDEAAQARLVRAYRAAGRRAQAFAVYHRVRRHLVDELLVDPGPELAAAHVELLTETAPPADRGTPPTDRAAPPTDRAASAVDRAALRAGGVAPAMGGVAPAPPTGASAAPAVQPPATGAPAVQPLPRVPAQLPADVPDFTGRTGELAQLDAVVAEAAAGGGASPAAVVISAVAGTAGVGKTALAVRWARRARVRFPDGQLYVNLRGYDPEQPVTPAEALAGFLLALGMRGQDIPQGLDDRAACYRSLLDGRRILVVLDNAASVEQVRPLLPGAETCAVLVTSRDLLSGLVARHGAQRINLDLLPRDDATDLVRRLLGDRAAAEPAAAAELVTRCARLPLALRVAAERCLARPAESLAHLVAELGDQQRRLRVLDAGGDPRTGVRAVFSWSYLQLPAAVALAFRRLGLHPGADFDAAVVAALTGTDPADAGQLLEELARVHLVQPAGDDRFGLHDLLRAYAVELSTEDPAADGRAALHGLLDWYHRAAVAAMDLLYPAERHRRPRAGDPLPAGTAGVAPGRGGQPPRFADRAAAQAWLDAERDNLVAVVIHAAAHGWPEYAVALATILLRYVESGGHSTAGVAMVTHALRACRELADQGAEARLLTDIGVIDAQQGRYDKAAEHLQQAIDLCGQIGDRVGQARAVGNLGHVYRWQGRYDLAAERLREAAVLCREVGDRVGQARALGNLGHVYLRQGRDGAAGQRLREAITICRGDRDTVGEAYALVSLGQVALRQGQPAQAAGHLRAALDLVARTSERAGEAHALEGLGAVEAATGHLDRALDHIQRSVALFRQLGERGGEAQATNSLGTVLRQAGAAGPARAQHAAALAVAVEIGDRYEQARASAGLAASCHATGDVEAAGPHWRRALALYLELGVPEAAEVQRQLAAVGDPSTPLAP